ncbi:hypothetical protein FFF34_000625 [Inquilinus sp. KBS0705]|nr:hypothetical protein FFF34_000625 [Inquilinus sp. KBS0705]
MKGKIFALSIVVSIIICNGLAGCKKGNTEVKTPDTTAIDTVHLLLGKWKVVEKREYHEGVDSIITTSGCSFSATYTFQSGNIFTYGKSSCSGDKSYTGTFIVDKKRNIKYYANGSNFTRGGGTIEILNTTTMVLYSSGGQNWYRTKYKRQ